MHVFVATNKRCNQVQSQRALDPIQSLLCRLRQVCPFSSLHSNIKCSEVAEEEAVVVEAAHLAVPLEAEVLLAVAVAEMVVEVVAAVAVVVAETVDEEDVAEEEEGEIYADLRGNILH